MSNRNNNNTGHNNTGNYNTGDYNTGHHNTGKWNSCDNETGFFNSKESDTIRVFNKPCSYKLWSAAKKPSFINFPLTEWISEYIMSEEEKLKIHHIKQQVDI